MKKWRFQVEGANTAREGAMKPQVEPDSDALLREAGRAVAVADSVDADRGILELEGCAATVGLRHSL